MVAGWAAGFEFVGVRPFRGLVSGVVVVFEEVGAAAVDTAAAGPFTGDALLSRGGSSAAGARVHRALFGAVDQGADERPVDQPGDRVVVDRGAVIERAAITAHMHDDLVVQSLGVRDRNGQRIRPLLRDRRPTTCPFGFGRSVGLVAEQGRVDRRLFAAGEWEPFPREPAWDSSLYSSSSEHRHANPDVWRAYEEAGLRASSQRGDGLGIARFKLESNGPWLVVEEEVAGAMAAYGEAQPATRINAEADDTWATWIGWLRRASLGFWVEWQGRCVDRFASDRASG
jgi:hypothetical protein